jgi:hypothetical protein
MAKSSFRTARALGLALFCCLFLWQRGAGANDFPTEARVGYVLACMSGGGEKGRHMRQCACVIDVIATELPYDNYVAAETILRMRKMNGEKGSLFRETDSLRESVDTLRSAETAAKENCL